MNAPLLLAATEDFLNAMKRPVPRGSSKETPNGTNNETAHGSRSNNYAERNNESDVSSSAAAGSDCGCGNSSGYLLATGNAHTNLIELHSQTENVFFSLLDWTDFALVLDA
jgi:hypothetical protein